MDKEITKVIFEANHIPTPKGTWMKRSTADHSLASTGLPLPLVVKPCSGGSSIGVYITQTEEEFDKAVKESFRYEDEIIIEEYIKGRELACGVIDGKALPVIETCPYPGRDSKENPGNFRACVSSTQARCLCPCGFPSDRGRQHLLSGV